MYFTPTGVTCQVKNEDCCMPLLESVFEAFPNIPINVDIKTNSDVLIDKVGGFFIYLSLNSFLSDDLNKYYLFNNIIHYSTFKLSSLSYQLCFDLNMLCFTVLGAKKLPNSNANKFRM